MAVTILAVIGSGNQANCPFGLHSYHQMRPSWSIPKSKAPKTSPKASRY
jgi:hypothetical protein